MVAWVDGVALATSTGMIGDGCGSGGVAALLHLHVIFIEGEHGQVGARARHVAGPAPAGQKATWVVQGGEWRAVSSGVCGAPVAAVATDAGVGGGGRERLSEGRGEGGRWGNAADVAGAANAGMGVGMT